MQALLTKLRQVLNMTPPVSLLELDRKPLQQKYMYTAAEIGLLSSHQQHTGFRILQPQFQEIEHFASEVSGCSFEVMTQPFAASRDIHYGSKDAKFYPVK